MNAAFLLRGLLFISETHLELCGILTLPLCYKWKPPLIFLLSLHFSKEILSQWIKINASSIWYYSPEKDHKLDYSHFGIMKKECEKQAAEVSYKSHSLPLASRFDLRRIFIWLWKYIWYIVPFAVLNPSISTPSIIISVPQWELARGSTQPLSKCTNLWGSSGSQLGRNWVMASATSSFDKTSQSPSVAKISTSSAPCSYLERS